MIKSISKEKAKAYMSHNGSYKRIADYSNGRGENCDIKQVKIEPHATYFTWRQIEPVEDGARCYYDDCNGIEGVYNDRGDLLRVVFKYNKFMISYEK